MPIILGCIGSSCSPQHQVIPIDKFNYLNLLLAKSAREGISGLSVTGVVILKLRFGNKHLIINRHLETFNINRNSFKSDLNGNIQPLKLEVSNNWKYPFIRMEAFYHLF